MTGKSLFYRDTAASEPIALDIVPLAIVWVKVMVSIEIRWVALARSNPNFLLLFTPSRFANDQNRLVGTVVDIPAPRPRPPAQSFWVNLVDGIIIDVSVPVVPVLYRVTGEEPAGTGIVESVSQAHQPRNGIVLVSVLPRKPERRRGSSRRRDAHPEGVGVEAVRFGLTAVGYRPRRAKRVRMVVLAGSSSRFPDEAARSLHVGGRAVTQHIGVNGVISEREENQLNTRVK